MIYGNRDPRLVIIRKADDLPTVTNSEVLVDVDGLVHPLGANEVWAAEVFLIGDADGTADIDVAFQVPAGATFDARGNTRNDGSAEHVRSVTQAAEFEFQCAGVGTNVYYFGCYGIIETGATPGDFQVQFAQATAHASDAKIKKNSYMILHRLA